MGQLEDMEMFVRIVDAGGINKAAEQLDIAKSAVSRRLNTLEKRLSTQLLTRTTRKSNLTEAGNRYYQHALSILEEVNLLNEQTSGKTSRIEGTLKITAPLSFGLLQLGNIIDEFARRNEQLNFQLDLSDRQIDLIGEGYELAIRIGKLDDSSLQAKRITSVRHVICASPDYLQQNGTPGNLEELSQHAFLQYSGGNNSLLLADKQGQPRRVEVNSKMKANNGDFLKQMAIKGHGIICLPTFITHQELTAGKLIPLLTEYSLPTMHAYAVYPKNRFLSLRCRHLIDFISDKLADTPVWEEPC
ncbi:LysR family transcriptional regulator [Pleionea sp. CnH1-48]|uniref:LysR family transcriptional regulator n=1 Tax=Pleionea sp. CnH1-48 TaxID=2954494 RepID=UPI002096E1C7|nr:LysR family transcriptional regulator [Pleionea sp. CnH1-48]MCO7224733.1 LysR family transcriptional regulator [Pleionea sp. CnH1-48]